MTTKTAAIGLLMLALLVPSIAATPARAQYAGDKSCVTPYQEVAVTNSVAPDYPDTARALGRFTVLVQVGVSSTGQATSESIYKSSGNADADKAALQAARLSSYQPKVANCLGVTSDYVFHADFVPPAAASCATPDRSIKVVKPVMPTIPASLQGSAPSYQAVVDVKVDAQGNVLSASIAQSTGNADVDKAIVSAAQKTTYLPAMQNCKPVAGEAWFHAGFGAKATPAPNPGG